MNWGKTIFEIRMRKGITQSELANSTGISRTSISLIERNKQIPNEKTINKIAEVFNTDVVFIELLAIDLSYLRSDIKGQFDSLYPNFKENIFKIILNSIGTE